MLAKEVAIDVAAVAAAAPHRRTGVATIVMPYCWQGIRTGEAGRSRWRLVTWLESARIVRMRKRSARNSQISSTARRSEVVRFLLELRRLRTVSILRCILAELPLYAYVCSRNPIYNRCATDSFIMCNVRFKQLQGFHSHTRTCYYSRETEEKPNLSVWWENAAFLLAFSLPLINLNIQSWGVQFEAWQCAALGYVFHDEH